MKVILDHPVSLPNDSLLTSPGVPNSLLSPWSTDTDTRASTSPECRGEESVQLPAPYLPTRGHHATSSVQMTAFLVHSFKIMDKFHVQQSQAQIEIHLTFT